MTLAEREAELATLTRLLDDAHKGRGALVVVRGPAGSGRTALLHAFAGVATGAGVRYLHAVASRAERALPLGVVEQLFRSAQPDAETAARVAALIDEIVLSCVLHAPDADDTALTTVPAFLRLCGELLDLARDQPLAIGVDDVHHADPVSLQCLLAVIRRADTAPVLVVLADRERRQARPLFAGELLRQPHSHQIRLRLLSPEGVATVLADRLGGVPGRLAGACWQASGGNPLLVNALAQDQPTRADASGDQLVVGDAFAEAVMSCLYRCESTLLRAARGLAVLGDPGILDRLLDVTPDVVTHALGALETTGLLDGGRFRAPAARMAVLDAMTPGERTALHRRAAQLLHEAGAPAEAVAPHLADGDEGADGSAEQAERWRADVLREAGKAAAAAGNLADALRYLRLGERACVDDRQRWAVRTQLVSAEWRIDPAVAARRLPELVSAMRGGWLSGGELAVLAQHLLWKGMEADADEVMRCIASSAGDGEAESVRALAATQPWLRFMYPDLSERLRHDGVLPPPGDPATADAGRRLTVVTSVPGPPRPIPEQVTRAERLLHGQYAEDLIMGANAMAVSELIYTDDLGAAASRCDRLRRTVAGRPWQALFTVMRASVSGRQGDLRAAEELARSGLQFMPPGGWGVLIGVPIAVLVLVMCGMGRFEEAAALLNFAVPEALFDTPFGLHYLQARGRFHLVTGQPDEALIDFLLCGDLMQRWRIDLPSMIPWRTDAAAAYIRLGQWHSARQLTEAQLGLLAAGLPRTRGISLRILAATVDRPSERSPLLQQSIQLLHTAGDQLELAHAYADLSRSYQEAGQQTQAHMMARRARRLVYECGAAALPLQNLPGTEQRQAPDPDAPPAMLPGQDGIARLSEAEQRVAGLAAMGHTNRQIAGKLFVTVSTVEQHLTRVYRKLKISRRADLLQKLPPGGVDVA
ncbi:AAA family ATPase [Dactylosporangium sp. NBC_01737]|uniref:helix-turn-helix transcriptional regulator n=1 Tax=Dactylosporangium sp. NBC_01737 TaxID=2975959 RepID=UPI002E0EBB8F|nr:AAA family ATPase [Dactylosporangium sp. NBC_01737]